MKVWKLAASPERQLSINRLCSLAGMMSVIAY
jgi:hypothetical protein